MHYLHKNPRLSLILLLLAASLPLTSQINAQHFRGRSFFLPVGSWFGIAEATEPTSGFPSTVTMLLSFQRDGILLGTDSTNFGVVGVQGSPAHGTWKYTGFRRVSGTFVWLQHANESGELVGYVRVQLEAQIEDFKTMSGTLSPQAFALDQNPLDPEAEGISLGTFEFVASRIPAVAGHSNP